MIRKIITIDEDKCNGCGLCTNACHEGALKIVDGKAKLISESYCDGLGNCLPECPTNAIRIVEREAAEFDEEAVMKHMEAKAAGREPAIAAAISDGNREKQAAAMHAPAFHHSGCPGSRARTIDRNTLSESQAGTVPNTTSQARAVSRLGQWPCQIKLVPVNAPYFDNANLLIAADCTAYAYANIHSDFMRNRITIIGCPKLDEIDYSEKLTQIFANHNIKSVTVLRMEVPCCGGIVHAVKNALVASGTMVPWKVVTVTTDGNILEE